MDPSNFREVMGFSNPGDQIYYEDAEDDDSVPPIQKVTKKNNILQTWGTAIMNLNALVYENIVQSTYWKNYLNEVTTFQQCSEEIYYNVSHLEPWERGTRKATGSGMQGAVRGVSAGGVISTAFCVMYKMFTLRLTRKQLVSMINNTQSVYTRGIGFLYIRYSQPPADLWQWMEPYLDDTEEIDPRSGGGELMTIGQMVRQMLTKLDWYGTLFPRIPVPIQKEIEAKFRDRSKMGEKPSEGKRTRSPLRSDRAGSSTHKKHRCGHHSRHHHCRKHRKKCPSKAKKAKRSE